MTPGTPSRRGQVPAGRGRAHPVPVPAGKRIHSAAGGGRIVEVAPGRLVGWVTRFAARNVGLADLTATPTAVIVRGGDGTTAELAVPFGPMDLDGKEPLEALLDHLSALGPLALVLVRAGANSVGVCKNGVVLSSSTDRRYVQGRTAAGGSSQQRFARRRANQRRESYDAAADTVAQIVTPLAQSLAGLVLAGDRAALAAVMADRRLASLAALPTRTIPDIAEPRRAVLDEVAHRSLDVIITVRPATPTT